MMFRNRDSVGLMIGHGKVFSCFDTLFVVLEKLFNVTTMSCEAFSNGSSSLPNVDLMAIITCNSINTVCSSTGATSFDVNKATINFVGKNSSFRKMFACLTTRSITFSVLVVIFLLVTRM